MSYAVFTVGQFIEGMGIVTAINSEEMENKFTRRYLEINGEEVGKIEKHEKGEACHVFGIGYLFA